MKSKSLLMALAISLIALSLVAQETGTLTDSRDGKIYKTVIIGTQIWMSENLNFNYKCWCYNNDTSNCTRYGCLYHQVMGIGVKVCPNGWHVPNSSEWDLLIEYLGGPIIAAEKMKSEFGWEINGNGTNSSGFSALPSGYIQLNNSQNGGYTLSYKEGYDGYGSVWWASDGLFSMDSGKQLFNFYYLNTKIQGAIVDSHNAYSVRCLKD